EFIGADSQLNLARTLSQAGMMRKKIKKNALRQRKAQLIFMSTIYEKYSKDLLAGQAAASRHPKAMDNAKMWTRHPEMGNLRNEQVHFIKDGRHTILRRHSVPPSARSGVESPPQIA